MSLNIKKRFFVIGFDFVRVVSCRVGKIFGVRVSYVLDILVFVFVTCRVEKFDTRPSLLESRDSVLHPEEYRFYRGG